MAASKPKPKKDKKELSPNHVKHLRAMMDMARDPSQIAHPLVIPPPGASQKGYAAEQVSGDDQLIPAKTGEYIIPEPVVKRKGTQFFDNLIKKCLEESLPEGAADSVAAKAGSGTPSTGYKWGGYIEGEPEDIDQNIDFGRPSTTATGGQQRSGNWKPSYRFNPKAYGDFSAPDSLGTDPRTFNALTTFGHNPWVNGIASYYPPSYAPPSGNLPGSWQGSTTIPTYFNPQGYPYAVPSDYNLITARHTAQKRTR